tara:strand:- start:36 stop:191 length:156 start_codon:yes stop_codon:yes gene_type:complete
MLLTILFSMNLLVLLSRVLALTIGTLSCSPISSISTLDLLDHVVLENALHI